MDTEDITSQKIAAGFKELAKLPENNPGPVFQLDTTGKIFLANEASRRLFANDGLAGDNWMAICPDFNQQDWQKILDSHTPVKYEVEVREYIYVFTFVRPGMGDFVYAYGNDVTEFRHAQQQLSAQAATLKELARFPEMNPGPVFRLSLEGNVILANAAARNIFGENIVTQNWFDIFPGMNDKTWEEIKSSKEIYSLEAHIGSCHYVFAHRRDFMSNLVFVYGSDITTQKKAEQALVQSEKMATLGTLAAGVAHELNNPAAATRRAAEQLRSAFSKLEKSHLVLNASPLSPEGKVKIERIEEQALEKSKQIINLDPLTRSDRETEIEDWLDEQDVPDPWDLAPGLVALGIDTSQLESLALIFKGKELVAVLNWMTSIFLVYTLLNEIGQGSTRISEIVGALKNYSYLGQAPVQTVNLHEGIDNTLVILRNKLKQGINVTREFADDLPPIFAYGSELNQVWTNILDNAVDAMNGKGEITIRTHKEGPWAIVEIEDNGPGIPKEIQSRIFDPFFTTKAPGKGTGLGLSTTYGIVKEKHHGNISIESRQGFTRFTVKLPIEKLQNITTDQKI